MGGWAALARLEPTPIRPPSTAGAASGCTDKALGPHPARACHVPDFVAILARFEARPRSPTGLSSFSAGPGCWPRGRLEAEADLGPNEDPTASAGEWSPGTVFAAASSRKPRARFVDLFALPGNRFRKFGPKAALDRPTGRAPKQYRTRNSHG